MNAAGMLCLGFAVVFAGGCSEVDDSFYLSINIGTNTLIHTDGNMSVTTNGLSVFINSNFCQFVSVGFAMKPIDKYVQNGINTIKVVGTVAAPVEITIASQRMHDRQASRVLLNRRIVGLADDREWGGTFRARTTKELPIFEKGQITDRLQAEHEIDVILHKLYEACVSSDKEEFQQITLNGYCRYSPSECAAESSSVEALFTRLKLLPFPVKIHFIYGRSLVCAYSDIVNQQMVLFESVDTNGCSIGCIDFAKIDGHWVVW